MRLPHGVAGWHRIVELPLSGLRLLRRIKAFLSARWAPGEADDDGDEGDDDDNEMWIW